MGRSAHSPRASSLQIIALLVANDRELLERIRALTEAMAEGQALPRSKMEPIVTDGYARALELDAECLRIEQRIDELTEETVAGAGDAGRGAVGPAQAPARGKPAEQRAPRAARATAKSSQKLRNRPRRPSRHGLVAASQATP